MSKRKINLEEIFNNNFDCYTEFGLKLECINEQPALTKIKFKELCLDFGKQLLELAAENAKTKDKYTSVGPAGYIGKVVDKQSLLDTIKQVE